MQLLKLVNAENVIEKLRNEKVDVSLAYKFMKFIQKASNEIKFYNDEINTIIEKYAIRNDDGTMQSHDNMVQLDVSRQDEYNEEFKKLGETEVEFPEIKFELKELQGLQLSAMDILYLDDFIKEA